MDNSELYGRCQILKDWPDWDYSIHCEKPQIDRQERANTYPFTFVLFEETESARFSSTSELPYYDTTLSSCTCMDFQERHLPCKHMYRLAEELGYIDIVKRKPVHTFDKDKLMNIKQSSDIDNEPDQIKRRESGMSSKCTPVEIDYDNRTAIFKGSGKTPYTTTESTCTCRDYFVRRLPCKHIYRLRYELDNQ